MAIYLNGTLIAQANKVFFNGTQLSSTGKVYGNGTQVWTGGTLTLIEQVFNASGTFTVPSNAVNNTFYVGCTGGGGGALTGYAPYSGGGSGRVSGSFVLTPSAQISVTVGSGGNNAKHANFLCTTVAGNGGTSTFGAYVSCSGGGGARNCTRGYGTNGGGNGSDVDVAVSTISSCPAMFTLTGGTVDNTNKFYTAKSYGTSTFDTGGGGCYGNGSVNPAPAAPANSGGGGGSAGGAGVGAASASGKVVIYYYSYV